MKRAIFFSLLISAAAGSLVVGMGVPRASERKGDDVLGQQTNQKNDIEKIPEAWRGTWKVTVAYRAIQEFNRGTITLMVIDASGNTATTTRTF